MSDDSEQDLPWIGPGRYGQDDKLEQVETLIYKGECNLEQEIVDEFVRLGALETCPGRACSRGCTKTCRAQCYSNDMAGSCSALLCLIIVGCLLFLTFFAIFYIVPRVTSTLERTTGCTVVRFDYEDFAKTAEGECACHIRCRNYDTDYCVQLLVQYTNDDGNQAVRTLDRSETARHCTADSFPHCPTGDAYTDIYNYMTIGSTFLCLSHPDLLITDIFDVLSLIHIGWPVGIILLSLIWLTCICCTCGCKYISVGDYPSDVKAIADGLGSKGIFTIVNLSEVDRARIVREWKTVCVRMVSDEGSGPKGASIPGEMHQQEAVPQVQVHQQPQVHQVQVYQHQVPQASIPLAPPAYAPPAYEGTSHDKKSTVSASQSAGFTAHVSHEEKAGKYVPENEVSQEEEDEDEEDEEKDEEGEEGEGEDEEGEDEEGEDEEGEEENIEYHIPEDQSGEHLSQEQISEDLSTEDICVLPGPHDNVPSGPMTEESAELQRHREFEAERLMEQGQINLPLEHVPGHDNLASTRPKWHA